jgi:hypothetical protein
VGVKVPDATVKNYTTTNYWATGEVSSPPIINGVTVATTVAPDGFIGNISGWCTQCHTRYLAPSGSYKTDSGDAMYKYRHRSDTINKVGGANCITCHVSHGSNASMTGAASSGVTQPDGSASSSSRLLRVDNRGTCVMCHNV